MDSGKSEIKGVNWRKILPGVLGVGLIDVGQRVQMIIYKMSKF